MSDLKYIVEIIPVNALNIYNSVSVQRAENSELSGKVIHTDECRAHVNSHCISTFSNQMVYSAAY